MEKTEEVLVNLRVIVIGAGPVGLAAAHGLLESGADVTVLEAGPRGRPQGSGLSLFGNGVAALESLGLGPSLRRLTGDVAPAFGGIRSPGGGWLTHSSERSLAGMRVVHREDLHALLVEQLPSGTVRFGSAAELVSPEPCAVSLAGGETLEAELVVVADGIRSRSRRLITTDPGVRSAGYGAWRGVTRTPVAGVVPSETWGAGLRFGLVPLTDGRIYWFGVSSSSAMGTDDHRAQVLDLFGGWHEPIAQVVRSTDADVASWLPIEELARPLQTFVRGRAVLVGDAAHAMTPNLGQGANQGFEDAATLCSLLRNGVDVEHAVAQYDALRRPRTRHVARSSRFVGRVGQLSRPSLVRVRDALMRATPDAVTAWQFREFEGWGAP